MSSLSTLLEVSNVTALPLTFFSHKEVHVITAMWLQPTTTTSLFDHPTTSAHANDDNDMTMPRHQLKG